MEEFKGTPGPWKYTVRNVNEMMTTFHGVAIGDTYIEAATRNEREDARLISAAPDLLEACLRLRNQLYAAGYDSKEKSLNPTEELLFQTEQVIAKALGKE
ncbi:hypothetical protein [Kluyvera ascorbata]|uniref:hypothetical protein n=1 Tax=Kluyvera ascorbata TaxID=51288 RepID=UPI002062D86C|nr:hypothetical protein [Kluyvera ascorbata]UPQ70577.1 hypothetical protein MY052_17780 [Kluyvera ascorbata]